MLKLNLNLDSLHDTLEKFNHAIIMHGALISDLQSQLEFKSSDRSLGHVFERLSTSISRELGERHAKFQLDDPNFVADEQGTADSKYFKA